MTVTREEAEHTALAMDRAILDDLTPVRQVRYELAARCREWGSAVELLDDVGEELAVIELVDNVTKGMYLFDMKRGRCKIRRKLNGGTTLHCSDDNDPDPRGWYCDFYGGTSPVVVAR